MAGLSFPEGCGPLALVGGAEWSAGCCFDAELLGASATRRVSVLPTAAAYEHPERVAARASDYFAGLGAEVETIPVLGRRDAEESALANQVRAAAFVYVASGSPLHLRSVFKSSPVWDALVAAWSHGAVLAAAAAGAMVLGDPMMDPRGGALTLGLGLVPRLVVLPHADQWSDEKGRRTFLLAQGDLRLVAIDPQTALIRWPDGRWETSGPGSVTVYVNGEPAELAALAG